ncbi:ATP-binding cassette domain-containing protein [Deinococcus soli (ex Cha et al. 2016)]|uniref:ATP-binding cassette domain-containing protein n=1 Tax=Deinococcus soli (ex Cha et al. 2016) TaxID=1309411 RepID=UPI001665CE51|nr:excinuclease ABC subunit UvrA [Deinococcus soli (ex Cha et al. 2016)]GGB73584.1 UvrABC system protein A [Deinococcus soli (ex Cha et al. 2016)]
MNDHLAERGHVQVRGAREHNLKDISVSLPRDALVVFTGISGSGKSTLAFGTLYAEAQRRYLESVSPYARRLFNQVGVPDVDAIEGLPPAIALQQQRGTPTARSSVGSVTTLSNLLRMLYSRAGDYPPGQDIVYADGFSPNTPDGACQECHGLGRVYTVTEDSMVPDPSLTIRERAIAAWPTAWGGQNQRDILVSLGIDVDRPWNELPQDTRDWILFSEEQPVVPVYPGFTPEETRRAVKRKLEPGYMGTFSSARRHVMHTFADTESASMKKRVLEYMIVQDCPLCHGKRLRQEALNVTFAGLDITEFSRLPLATAATLLLPFAEERDPGHAERSKNRPEQAIALQRMAEDLTRRMNVLLDLGLGYLQLERSTPTLSPGELQRLRLATQLYSNLFGVVYVLDEPSAGLHPADTEALLTALDGLKRGGNSLFVVEHELDIIRRADWLVDVGPGAGEQGGQILYSGPPKGLNEISDSATARYLFAEPQARTTPLRTPQGWLELNHVTRHNMHDLSVRFPLGVLTSITGISGSGKSTLVSQALVEALAHHFGHPLEQDAPEADDETTHRTGEVAHLGGDLAQITRLIQVDQKPIGRTPRSNMATYTGLFDQVRKLFAATPLAKQRGYAAGRFSFNVKGGRCEYCQGEGWMMVELLFLPSVYAPCSVCHGTRYNAETLEVTYKGKNVAEVLSLTVDAASDFFDQEPNMTRLLDTLREVGLGYLRLGQPATELSGGEAQRIKLATELHRSGRGGTVYILDEPTTGLHPADIDRLQKQLDKLVEAGNTVIAVEHKMQMVAGSDWVIDIGPGAGDQGGQVVVQGTPEVVAASGESKTAPYLRATLRTAG